MSSPPDVYLTTVCETDVLLVRFWPGSSDMINTTEDLNDETDSIYVDLDSDGKLVGVEIVSASKIVAGMPTIASVAQRWYEPMPDGRVRVSLSGEPLPSSGVTRQRALDLDLDAVFHDRMLVAFEVKRDQIATVY